MVEYFEVVKVEEIPETLEECDKGVDGNAETGSMRRVQSGTIRFVAAR